MFKKRSAKVSFPEIEHEVLAFWQQNRIFAQSVENRKDRELFNFYDGPPFATGLPHYGHILAGAIKDAIPRYKTMKGYYVPRVLGWDCHGLPVEYEIEKERKITGKKQIEEWGVGNFNDACKSIVFRYTKEWEKTINRMGRWVDFEHSYATMDRHYMESIWWVFRQIWDKNFIYEDYRSTWYCPRCGTPLSNFEVNQGYKDNTKDPSIFVKMQLVEDPKTYFLVWTTTPWTLPGNAAIAANPEYEYVKIKLKDAEPGSEVQLNTEQIESVGQCLILSKARLAVIKQPYEIVKTFKAKDLEGKQYLPLYNFISTDKNKHRLVLADFVTQDDGTGLVHIAPAFGEEDFNLGKKLDLPIFRTVDEAGCMSKEVTLWAGVFFKDADNLIAEELLKRGLRYGYGSMEHTYPFCWRCDSPLLNYAVKTWYIRVTEVRDRLLVNNDQINWMPEHVKDGRFGKWLESVRDWNVSRNRFWGTPLPIWRCDGCGKTECLGSIAELKERATPIFKLRIDALDLHRPYIDEIELECQDCGKPMHRIEEVLDCWFESGSMPYAQKHYPFEHKDEFEQNFPAQFIAEGMDQTRGWFYTLHVIATILFDKPSFQNCIVNGIGLDEHGVKLSKRLRNYVEPEKLMDSVGADAMRYFLFANTPMGEDWRFSDDLVKEKVRKVLMIWWNSYVFFLTYACIDNWEPPQSTGATASVNLLDKWVLSRLHSLTREMTDAFDNYDLTRASRPIESFVAELSTWYIRRSRRRFWKSESDSDKAGAYQTLYTVLVTLAKLVAPIMPFVAEEMYRNLVSDQNLGEASSVHLSDYPVANLDLIDTKLEERMRLTMNIVETARALRSEMGVKVRQPLQDLVLLAKDKQDLSHLEPELLAIIEEEINVKEVKVVKDIPEKFPKREMPQAWIGVDPFVSEELRHEGLIRDLTREIQDGRKKAGFSIENRIETFLDFSSTDIQTAMQTWDVYMKKETLSNAITVAPFDASVVEFVKDVEIDSIKIKLGLKRA